ncbi:MAG: hypothetical protein M3O22_08290 [Pseudomonadota bacterium]|nr:hypothetical protein [Pseudomonadota bacterium]
MKSLMSGLVRRWVSLSDCAKALVLVLAIMFVVGVKHEAALLFRDRPSQAEMEKLLTLSDRGSWGVAGAV